MKINVIEKKFFSIFLFKSSSIFKMVTFAPPSVKLWINEWIYVSDRLIGVVARVFASVPGDQGSISGGVISKTLKMVLDTS